MEPTTTLRFPDRLHARAKIEATKQGLTLQEFVGQAVEAYLDRAKPVSAPSLIGKRIARLQPRSRTMVERFVALIETAPSLYLDLLEEYLKTARKMRKLFPVHQVTK